MQEHSAVPLPPVIQGGMGVAVSSWPLARAVAAAGQLGVVSGTALDAVLDWGIKRALYTEYCRNRGIDWCDLPRLHLAGRRAPSTPDPAGPALPDSGDPDAELPQQRARTDSGRFQALRNELFELDMRFLQVGNGLFTSLERAGVLEHEVISNRDLIPEAVRRPPDRTRARVRGECVERLSAQGTQGRYSCGWMNVFDHAENKQVDLRDPFETAMEWKEFSPRQPFPQDDETDGEENSRLAHLQRLLRSQPRARRASVSHDP